MPIKINEHYKSSFDQETDKVVEYAQKIKRWRQDHRTPEEDEVKDIERLYEKLIEHTRELKRAIEGYYDIRL